MRGRMTRLLKGAGVYVLLLALLGTNVWAVEEPGNATVQLTENGISFGTGSTSDPEQQEPQETPVVLDGQEGPAGDAADDQAEPDAVNQTEPETEEPDAGIMTLDEARLIDDGQIRVTDYNSGKGTFRVVISGVDTEQVKEILVPVWSVVNGQDDIV